MKTLIYLSLISTSSLIANESEYTNQIVQILEDGTQQYLSDIPSSGSDHSPTPIIGESIFELHTTHNESGASYHLDDHIMNGYNPKVTVKITSQDPNIYQNGQRYTRIGRPYSIDYNISGILPNSEVTAAQAVIFEKAKTTTLATGSSETKYTTKTVNIDGTSSASDNAQIGTATETRDIYNFYKNVDPDQDYAASIVSATVRTFPNASGALLNVTEDDSPATSFGETDENHDYLTDETYDDFPSITINVDNIYPGAQVILRVYPTGNTPDPTNDITLVTTGTGGAYSNTFNQNEVANTLANIDIVATKIKTTYTTDLIERSVYGDIILDSGQAALQIKTIVVNAQVIDSE